MKPMAQLTYLIYIYIYKRYIAFFSNRGIQRSWPFFHQRKSQGNDSPSAFIVAVFTALPFDVGKQEKKEEGGKGVFECFARVSVSPLNRVTLPTRSHLFRIHRVIHRSWKLKTKIHEI